MNNEIGRAATILKSGNSINFKTGDWKTKYPIHSKDICKNCMMCIPYCPEDCIKQKDGILTDIDLDFCKGCGVCAKVCPFKAIKMEDKNKGGI